MNEKQIPYEYDVFISYNTADEAWVRGELLPRLENAGLKVYIDFRYIRFGDSIIRELEQAIETSRKMLIVLTPDYLKGKWSSSEIDFMKLLAPSNRTGFVIPILKKACKLPPSLLYLTYADFTNPSNLEASWRQLLGSLGQQEVESRQVEHENNASQNTLKTLSLQRYSDKARYFTQHIGNKVSIDMVQIPGGSFMMGSPETEEGHESNESPQHLVTLPSFFMGKYPVTQAQWRSVVSSTTQVKRSIDPEPSNFDGDDLPVEQVSWLDAEEFCLRLSKLSDREYRLPSEAEWEYACRAGTATPFHFGATIGSDIANYRAQDWELGGTTYPGKYGPGELGKFRETTTPVGSFKIANRFGLYDMHGNVWEWCLDHWHDSYADAPEDGSAWLDLSAEENAPRVLRGGSWYYYPAYCRSASRLGVNADDRFDTVGFRVVSPARILL
jgi:formylglycine-generating enzyme required for sulfatase activity